MHCWQYVRDHCYNAGNMYAASGCVCVCGTTYVWSLLLHVSFRFFLWNCRISTDARTVRGIALPSQYRQRSWPGICVDCGIELFRYYRQQYCLIMKVNCFKIWLLSKLFLFWFDDQNLNLICSHEVLCRWWQFVECPWSWNERKEWKELLSNTSRF